MVETFFQKKSYGKVTIVNNPVLRLLKMKEQKDKFFKAMPSKKAHIKELKEKIHTFFEEYQGFFGHNWALVKVYVEGIDYELDQVRKMFPWCTQNLLLYLNMCLNSKHGMLGGCQTPPPKRTWL